jgi:hypothetical protein
MKHLKTYRGYVNNGYKLPPTPTASQLMCFKMGKADGWGTFLKFMATRYSLLLGPLLWECPNHWALPYTKGSVPC